MELIAMLIVAMLPIDRAEVNARTTLHLAGYYGAKLGRSRAEDGYFCVARLDRGYAMMRCSGSTQEPCTMKVVR